MQDTAGNEQLTAPDTAVVVADPLPASVLAQLPPQVGSTEPSTSEPEPAPAPTQPPLIVVEQLTKTFGRERPAVGGVSFSINLHETVGLIGPNGSGKSTTQRMMATVLRPSSGTISYGGTAVDYRRDLQYVRSFIGYVPQGNCLYGDLTIEENLFLFSQPYGMSRILQASSIQALLGRLHLDAHKHYLVRDLSGGLAKRASIAAALVHQPKVLYLDEVTMGLDPVSRRNIWGLIEELKQTTTIVMTTHYLDEVEALCDRIVVLASGQVIENGQPAQVVAKYGYHNLDEVLEHIIRAEQ